MRNLPEKINICLQLHKVLNINDIMIRQYSYRCFLYCMYNLCNDSVIVTLTHIESFRSSASIMPHRWRCSYFSLCVFANKLHSKSIICSLKSAAIFTEKTSILLLKMISNFHLPILAYNDYYF